MRWLECSPLWFDDVGYVAFCDLLILYTFTRPFMLLLAGSEFMRNRSAFGIKPVTTS